MILRLLRNSLMLSLLMFSQLHVKCGHSAVLEGRAILPLQNISDGKEMEKFSQRRDSCSQGDFHTKPEFFHVTEYKRSIFELPFGAIFETVYGMGYCLTASLINPVLERLSGETFCECDCYHSHGASDYKFCEHPDFPCRCIYTEEDHKKLSIYHDNLGSLIPESKEVPDYAPTNQLLKNSTFVNHKSIPQGTEVKIETRTKNGNKDDLCKPVFELGVQFACALIDDGGNPFYTFGGNHIFPVDICSID